MKKLFQCTNCQKLFVCPMRSVLPKHPVTGELGRCDHCGHDQFILTFAATPSQKPLFTRPEVSLETR